MSWRIHVVGAYGASEAEFRAALDSTGRQGGGSSQFRISSSGPWMWANASVWCVGGGEIDAALGALPAPALRVTSADGVLWTLTLMRPDRKPFRGVHHFTWVGAAPPDSPLDNEPDEDFPENELEEVAGVPKFVPELQFLWDFEEEARLMKEQTEETEATVEGVDDYADYGVTLPEAVIAEMKQQPYRASYTAFHAHSRQIVEALEEFGFTFDRAAMLALLTEGPLTEQESGSDIGNMPRFLHLLGIEGVFAENPDVGRPTDVDDEDVDDEDADEDLDPAQYPPGELFARFEPLLAERRLVELSGGCVPVAYPAFLHLLAHLCAENPHTSLAIEYPDATLPPPSSWENLNDLEIRQEGAAWRGCFRTPLFWLHVEEREELESHEITAAVGAPPDGARLELACLVDGLAEKCHRYEGVYRDGRLELQRAYPPIAASVLGEALALLEQIIGPRPIALKSEQEAEAVRRDYLRAENEPPKIRNGKILPHPGGRRCVVQTLFFERFADRGPWDIAAARRLFEEDWDLFEQTIAGGDPPSCDGDDDSNDVEEASEELGQLQGLLHSLQESAEQLEQAKIVPHSDEVLYEGRTGKFLRASLADLTYIPPERLAEHDAALAALGFESSFDSTGDVDQRQEITRLYTGRREAVSLLSYRNENNLTGWAPVSDGAVLVDFSQGTREFHTHFDDGSTLVTTSINTLSSKPEVGVYIRAYEDVSLATLWAKHLDGVGRFLEHKHATPVDHTQFADPSALLAQIDDLFCRFLGSA